MPVESKYPPIDIPKVDLWTFLLERKNREFSDEKGISNLGIYLFYWCRVVQPR